jgi:hypothetical protein
MWRRLDPVWTYVSEERIASIFREEKSDSEEPAWAGGCSQCEARDCALVRCACDLPTRDCHPSTIYETGVQYKIPYSASK